MKMKREEKRKQLWRTIVLTICFILLPGNVKASEEQDHMTTELTEDLDFRELDQFVSEQGGITDDFSETVKNLISDGLGTEMMRKIGTGLLDQLTAEIVQNKKLLLEVILLTFGFSVLKNFAGTFQGSYVSKLCFILMYCVLTVLLLQSFFTLQGVVQITLQKCVEFMKILIPVFCTSMIFSSNTASMMGFYQMAFLIVYLIEWLFLELFFPMVHIYVLLEVLAHFLPEEHFSNLTELLYDGINWGIRIAGIFVLGLNVVQNLVMTAKDRISHSVITKTAAVIPGAGNTFGSIMELILSSGMLVKNCVGVAGLLILVFLCLIPLIKTACLAFFYKIAAAVTEPVADARICGCLKGMTNGGILYLKLLGYCMLLFFLTIALTAAASGYIF